ncbi:hypothetical protein AKO1_002246 [Acrasis kona]|uniref:Uncharacterized protein n=1 Tax=Acrasis kona TaxID=1008807 RepID=A0AAW2ZCH8_9EUKA
MIFQPLKEKKQAFYIGFGGENSPTRHFSPNNLQPSSNSGWYINLVAANNNPEEMIPGVFILDTFNTKRDVESLIRNVEANTISKIRQSYPEFNNRFYMTNIRL